MKLERLLMLPLILSTQLICYSPLALTKTSIEPTRKPAEPSLPTENPNPVSPSPKTTQTHYNFANELLKQLLASMVRDKFYLNLNLDITYANRRSEPIQYSFLDIETVMQFKTKPEGINVSIFAPRDDRNEEEKKLDFKFKLDLNNRFAVLHLKKGSKINEFIGDIQFFIVDKNAKLKPASINLKISNDLLDIKELQLFGAVIKINLPEPETNSDTSASATQKNLQKGLFKALLECKAESQVTDVLTGEVYFAPLEKCLFNFDGEHIKVQYKDAKRTLPQNLL